MSTDHVGKRIAKCLTLNETTKTLDTTTTQASTSTTDSAEILPIKLTQQKYQHEVITIPQKNNSNDRSTNNAPMSTNRPFVVMRKFNKGTANNSNCTNEEYIADLSKSLTANQSLKNDSGNPTSPSSLSSCSPSSPTGGDPGSAELRQLKRDCDPQFSRFADYFVICGLDLDTGLEPDRFAGK